MLAMTAALGRMEEFRLHAGALRDRRHRRRDRRAAVPDRGVLRCPRGRRRPARRAGRARRGARRKGQRGRRRLRRGSATWAASSPRTSSQAGHPVVAYDAAGPAASPRAPTSLATGRRRRPASATWSCSACPTAPCPGRWRREILAAGDRRATHVVDTSTSAWLPPGRWRGCSPRAASRTSTRRCRGRGRCPGPNARGHVRRHRRRVHARRTGARRA